MSYWYFSVRPIRDAHGAIPWMTVDPRWNSPVPSDHAEYPREVLAEKAANLLHTLRDDRAPQHVVNQHSAERGSKHNPDIQEIACVPVKRITGANADVAEWGLHGYIRTVRGHEWVSPSPKGSGTFDDPWPICR